MCEVGLLYPNVHSYHFWSSIGLFLISQVRFMCISLRCGMTTIILPSKIYGSQKVPVEISWQLNMCERQVERTMLEYAHTYTDKFPGI